MSEQVTEPTPTPTPPPTPTPVASWGDWLLFPFAKLRQGMAGFRAGTGALLTFLERPFALAVIIALVGGFVGGEATKVSLSALWSDLLEWLKPTPKPPTPPTPVDPLTQAFQTAYNADADTDKAKSLAFLQAAYAAMATAVPTWTDVKNNGQALAKIKAVVDAPGSGLTANQVVNLRKAIGAEMSAVFGTTASTPIDQTALASELTKVSAALKGVK